MYRSLYILAVPIMVSAFFTSGAAACTLAPEEVEAKAFLASSKPHKVVFRARVHTIEDLGKNQYGRPSQRVTFKVDRWWRGPRREYVIAIGETGIMADTSCEDTYDFWVKPDTEWIIFGTEVDGVVRPKPWLSISKAHQRDYDDILKSLRNVRWKER